MNEQKTKQRSNTLADEFDVSHEQLEKAFEEFIREDPPKEKSKGLVNVATVTGAIMLVIVFFATLQIIGLELGPDVLSMLPGLSLIAGVLVLILGLGWFSRRKSRKKKFKASDIPDFKIKDRSSANSTTGKGRSATTDFEPYAYRRKKKFHLSRKDKKIMGVCGGIGEYFGVDPTIVRIIFMLSVVFYGTPILLYFILGIVIKKEPKRLDET